MNDTKIYLCQADRSILGYITGIKTDTCSLTKNATDLWEITFDVDRYVDVEGNLVQSDYYDSIDDMMKLYLDSENIQAFFVIDSEPTVKGESFQETKTVTAHSIECELNHMYLKNLKINCGTPDSQEYLVTDENNNPTNIDVYTNLPKEYISLVNYDNHQLSLLHLALQGTGWTVKDNIDKEVCEIKKSFETSESVYSFLMKTVSSTASVMFEFDRKHKQVGAVKIENYGEDTGVFVTMRNLMNNFEVSSSSDDSIMTKLIPTGANSLGVEYVNFGQSHIINLDYFMNTLNEYGDYKYVSADLHDKYNLWKNYRNAESVGYDGKEYTRRELYRELTKLYNKTILDISEVHNRLPNDGCVIDYKTFPLEDLKISLQAYNNALVALVTIYKNEYGVTEIGAYPDCTPIPSTATNIKDTPYWYDYYAYQEKIIPQVTEALKMYCQTDENGNLVTDENGDFIELEFGNPDYYADETIVKNIDAYLYEWSLYGLDELEAKKKAWSEAANILYNECFIASGTVESPVYCTPDDNGWDSLSDEQKSRFTSKDAFINKLNQYLDYMSFDDARENSITKTVGKGIIRQCEDAIIERKNEIANIQIKQDEYNSQRKELASSVSLENFFTADDLIIINSMLREKEYSNEHIITTSLDDVVSTVDVQEELYQEAIKELDKLAQPQYSFRTELDNIYSLEEFKAYREPFDVGNFIRVGLEIHEDLYDNNYIKLRLISISYNPLEISEDLSVEFSTMTRSLNTVSDLAFLLDSQSSSSGGGTSSGSSSGGTYGDNDANVQISNNMLNALLKTELFGTTVTDLILDSMKANKGNFNTLFAHSGVFDSLESGQIKVSGDCLFDRIKSKNYESNKSGSHLNLSDGSFEFAGGLLKYDSKNGLSISGYSSDEDFSALINGLSKGTTTINGGCITTGNIKSANWNGTVSNPIGNTAGSIICLNDGKFNFAGGKLKWDGSKLSVVGDIVAKSLTLDSSVKVDTSNINGLSQVATSGDFNDLTNTDNILQTDDISTSVSTDANGITTKTITIGNTTYTTKQSDNYVITNVGIGTQNAEHTNSYFKISKDGLLEANNALIYGTVYATDGRFSGDVIANTLTANVSGSIAGWSFNDKAFYKNNINIGSKEGFYIGEDGISIGDYFIVDENGMKSQNIDLANDVYDSDVVLSYFEISSTENVEIILSNLTIGNNVTLQIDWWLYLEDIMTRENNSYQFTVSNNIKVYSSNNVLEENITASYNDMTHEVQVIIPAQIILNYGSSYNKKRPNTLESISTAHSQFGIKHTGGVKKVKIGSKVFDGTLLYKNYGLIIDTINKKISGDRFELTTTKFDVYGEFSFNFYGNVSSTDARAILNYNGFKHKALYSQQSLTDKRALYVGSDGTISAVSSSRRYKQDISTNLDDVFNPHRIYDLPVSQFRYKEDFGGGDDSDLYIGFIAEDVAKHYPPAARWNADHTEVDTWEMSDMFPALVKLIQEQHADIEKLKEEIESLKK